MWLLKQILRLYYHVNTSLIPYIPPLSSGVKSTVGKKCVLLTASAHLCPFPSLLNIFSSKCPHFFHLLSFNNHHSVKLMFIYILVMEPDFLFFASTGLFGKRKRAVYSSGVPAGQKMGANGYVVLTTSSPEAITACKSKMWRREMEDFSLARCKTETRILQSW